MRKILLGLLLIGTVLIGVSCSFKNDDFDVLDSTLNDIDKLNQEAEIMNFEELNYGLDNNQLVDLSQELTYGDFLNKKDELLETHYNLRITKLESRLLVKDIKTLTKELRNEDLILSLETKDLIKESLVIIKGNLNLIKVDLGNGYLKLRDLKGMYQKDNLEMIIEVFSDVNIVLSERNELINTINVELNKVKEILSLL
ncbi:MAG: hypothetical protein PHF05_07205 [Candidatus Izemoplasmatales bacterium]|nr:hypothetical protein [Candidatus Izemoplasmatales bacterium]